MSKRYVRPTDPEDMPTRAEAEADQRCPRCHRYEVGDDKCRCDQ